jgi:hypothetical protein
VEEPPKKEMRNLADEAGNSNAEGREGER